MKRFLLAVGMVSLLSGCFYTPYYLEGGIYSHGHEGGGHERGDD